MTFSSNSQAAKAKVQPAVGELGVQLREMFESMTEGPMPGHLVELVDQLERAYETRQAEAGVGEARTLVVS